MQWSNIQKGLNLVIFDNVDRRGRHYTSEIRQAEKHSTTGCHPFVETERLLHRS